jgi:hypothetical protein
MHTQLFEHERHISPPYLGGGMFASEEDHDPESDHEPNPDDADDADALEGAYKLGFEHGRQFADEVAPADGDDDSDDDGED